MSGYQSGGCQCGAIRYRVEEFGRSTICHCRMCQKAFGAPFGALVTAKKITWTRGERTVFESSNRNWRGFCSQCGTPLTYEYDGVLEVAICTLDDPDAAAPVMQVNTSTKTGFFDGLHTLPHLSLEEQQEFEAYNATIKSRQHPDHDTDHWPQTSERP